MWRLQSNLKPTHRQGFIHPTTHREDTTQDSRCYSIFSPQLEGCTSASQRNQLPQPTNKEQLRSLLGTLRHYSCFCPDFSSVARPLYELLKRDVRWKWQASHSNAVQALLSKIFKGSIVCYDISKPLFLISDAPKDGLGCRLRRWAITLRAYDYTIQYAKGEHMHLADTLSRLPSVFTKPLVPEVYMLELNSLQGINGGESLLRDIINTKDSELLQLKAYISNGWPKFCPHRMLPYSQSRDEYTLQSGLIYQGACIVPPKQLRLRILHILHEGHPGIVRMIRLARQYFWWPGIDSCVNSRVQKCFICQTYARKSTNARLSSWAEPTEFLERVHVDVAHYCGKPYLLLIDAHLKLVNVE